MNRNSLWAGLAALAAVHKANVLRTTCGLFREEARKAAAGHPQIAFDEANVDAICMWLLKNPQNYDVIVTTNLFGLALLPKDGTGEVVLLRCNGPHGGYNDSFDPEHPHWEHHVHQATAAMIEAGLRPEKAATVSRDFASFEEAVQYFLRVTNVRDGMSHFPKIMQRAFPFGEEPGT